MLNCLWDFPSWRGIFTVTCIQSINNPKFINISAISVPLSVCELLTQVIKVIILQMNFLQEYKHQLQI